ncbi:MAG: hypothetical protein K9L84_04340 [Candidatus Omnitrophica bacterium]|nr:hypothetical protein [Candidatus Omnitrophota bacterium]MCF7894270.1 hypothetical protein [Candidatus Omnitrophota bacterium]
MIRKDKLLVKLDKLQELEGRLIPLLDKHLSASLDFSQLPKEERDKTMEFLKSRVNIQKKHTESIKSIKEELTESEKNVY